METETVIDEEQLKVVKKLEEVLNFLKHTPIRNQDSLQYINKPLDDLMYSLKYLPTDPPFSHLPTEIKEDILGYLCNSGILVAASVCQEWKTILAPHVTELAIVKIEKQCSNEYECEDGKCYMPEAMLHTFTVLQLEAPLAICHSLTEVDPQVVSEGLGSASSLIIEGVGDYHDGKPILTNEQKEKLLVTLENRSTAMEFVDFRAIDLNSLDQDRLVNFLISKTRVLGLDESILGLNGSILDIRKLVGKLKDSTDYGLTCLSLYDVQYPQDLNEDMADALCQVPRVILGEDFHLKKETLVRFLQNILNRPTRIKGFFIQLNIIWSTLINPVDLKTIVDKMEVVELLGTFTHRQLQAARSCPGVTVSSDRIFKRT